MKKHQLSSHETAFTSKIAYGLLLTGTASAVFLSGIVVEGMMGVFLVCAGLALLACPPRLQVEKRLWILLGLCVALGSLALLPKHWFGEPAWRKNLVSLAVPLGHQVSTVPAETTFFLGVLAISGVVCLFTLAHPLRSRTMLWMASTTILVCAVYAGLAIYSQKTGFVFPFDKDPSFGFFPNRNHAATFLITGCMVALGVLGAMSQSRKWFHGLVAFIGLGFCGTALLVYSGSRGGVVFLCVGTILWLLGMGRSRWSKPLMVSFVLLFVGVMILFAVSKGEARNRIFQQLGIEKEKSAPEEPFANREMTMDGRIAIYKDTWRMICGNPPTGIGLGAFAYIFPFYQQDSLSEATAYHPESDWMWVVAETGPLSLLILVTSAVFLALRVRGQTSHVYWPVRWGFLCAILTAILHGLVDVPSHCIGLGWWFLLLAGMGLQIFPDQEKPSELWQRVIFGVAGAVALAMGVFLIRAEWFGGPSSPPYKADRAAPEIFRIFQVNKEKSSRFASEKIAESPMAGGLYSLKGLILLDFYDTDIDVEADQFFAAERALNPNWPEVPFRQGLLWREIDSSRVLALWKEALRRMQAIDDRRGSGTKGSLGLFSRLLQQSQKYPDLQQKLIVLAEQNTSKVLLWLQMVPAAVALNEIPKISANAQFLASMTLKEKIQFLRAWYEKGDRAALVEFANAHPDWQEAYWPVKIRQMVDRKNFEGAVTETIARYQLDLNLPASGNSKKLSIPDDRDNPLANFAYFWGAGNEITARRIIDEARTKAEKTGKRAPEIWKISVGLEMQAGRWDLAWTYLQRYLHETGREASF